MSITDKDKIFPLTENAFFVLMCLNKHDSIHGYGIRKEIMKLSNNRITLSTSSIYSIIDRFVRTDVASLSHTTNIGTKVVYYNITDKGKTLLDEEVNRMKYLISCAALESIQ